MSGPLYCFRRENGEHRFCTSLSELIEEEDIYRLLTKEDALREDLITDKKARFHNVVLNLDPMTEYKTVDLNTDVLEDFKLRTFDFPVDAMKPSYKLRFEIPYHLDNDTGGDFFLDDMYLCLGVEEGKISVDVELFQRPVEVFTLDSEVVTCVSGYVESVLNSKINVKPKESIRFFKLVNCRTFIPSRFFQGIFMLYQPLNRCEIFCLYARNLLRRLVTPISWMAFDSFYCRGPNQIRVTSPTPLVGHPHRVKFVAMLGLQISTSMSLTRDIDMLPMLEKIHLGNETWTMKDIVVDESRFDQCRSFFFVFDKRLRTREGVLKILSGKVFYEGDIALASSDSFSFLLDFCDDIDLRRAYLLRSFAIAW